MSTEIDRLEAVAAVVSHAGRVRWLRPELCEVGDQLCRLTEAQSIIAQRDARIAELREERDILQRQLGRFYSQSHGIPALSEIERLHAQIATWQARARLNPCRAQAVAVEHNKPLCKHGCGQVAVYSFIGECDECHAKTLSKQLGLPAPQKESGQ